MRLTRNIGTRVLLAVDSVIEYQGKAYKVIDCYRLPKVSVSGAWYCATILPIN